MKGVRGSTTAAVVAALLLSASRAGAHEGEAAGSGPSAWEWVFLGGLALAAVLFALGVGRLWRLPSGRRIVQPWRIAAFAGGSLTLVIALASPLEEDSRILFSMHMVQHELLIMVAAPLFVVAQPLVPLLWALPQQVRERFAKEVHGPALRAAWHFLTGAVTVWVLHGIALWAWHVPRLFEAALANDAVHAVQHLSFFWTAVFFWWALVHGRYGRLGYGLAVMFVFATSLYSGLLGALLTFAPSPWYATHAQRTTAAGGMALQDQQLAGLIMWVPAGVVFVVIALALFAAWLGEAERRVGFTRTQALVDEARGDAR